MLVVKEPEWDPSQVTLIRAVREYEEQLGDHGQPLAEAMSGDADPSNRDGLYFYRAGVKVTSPDGAVQYAPVVDFAKKAQMDAEDAYRTAAGEGANLNGLVFPVQRYERDKRADA